MIADTRRVSSNILNMFNNSLRMPAINVYSYATRTYYTNSTITTGKLWTQLKLYSYDDSRNHGMLFWVVLKTSETELFRNIGNQVNLLIQKVHQTFLPILPWRYSWCGLKWFYLQTQYTKTLYPSQTFQTRFCLCCTSTQTQLCPSGRPHESHHS